METKIFKVEDKARFKWQNLPFSLRIYYNYLLRQVVELDKDVILPLPGSNDLTPSYYNRNLCLALLAEVPPPASVAKGKATDAEKNAEAAAKASADPGGNTDLYAAFKLNMLVCTPDKDDRLIDHFCRPKFEYNRIMGGLGATQTPTGGKLNFNLTTSGLTVGAVLWLYFYERMGIFKILNALMNDHNYHGKYPISAKIANEDFQNGYARIMENLSLLYRMGLSSNLRDRICLYERVLGVTIENNLDVRCERNNGFMRTYNRLLDHMLEYYKAKQLAQAIQTANNNSIRSSVATQTAIRDTMQVLRQHFEPLEYGRNLVNTFTGIATVYATICLLRLVKDEIGVPRQYDSPEEFIPAAYDILVLNRPVTPSETNRYTIHDNCATYGYRLLTDIEFADLSQFSTHGQSGVLDKWLDDVEGLVEGYRNAFSAISEPASAMV